MEKATHPITVLTPKDADRFLEECCEKTGSIEAILLKSVLFLFVTNLKVGWVILSNGSVSVLVTLNKGKCENIHICSPYNAYITYYLCKSLCRSFIVSKLKKRYRKCTIMVPRLSQIMDSTLFTALKSGGFVLIPTKMVHIYDPEDNCLSKRNVKADLIKLFTMMNFVVKT